MSYKRSINLIRSGRGAIVADHGGGKCKAPTDWLKGDVYGSLVIRISRQECSRLDPKSAIYIS